MIAAAPPSGLGLLGISIAEERAYRALLRSPGAALETLAQQLGLPAAELADTLAGLVRQGLARPAGSEPARWVPSPPDLAIGSLLLQRQRQLEQARQEVQSFLHEHRDHAAPEPLVEVIGADPAAQALPHLQCHRQARREVLRLVSPPFFPLPVPTDEHHASARARGVRYRSIVDPDSGPADAWGATTRHELATGGEVRLLAGLPFRMIVSDRRQGLLPLCADDPHGPLLLLRGSAAVDALARLFEHLWATATPVALASNGEVVAGERANAWPPPLEPLVPLLAAGVQDKRLADQLGVSERTLMRRVESLYRTLGARTRFQAGWLAARRQGG